jgi:hypothetical protein
MESIGNEELLATYHDWLEVDGLLISPEMIEQWTVEARRLAEFIAPLPLIEATTLEVKEYRWKNSRSRPHCLGGLDALLSFLTYQRACWRDRRKNNTVSSNSKFRLGGI